jgi:exportin-7
MVQTPQNSIVSLQLINTSMWFVQHFTSITQELIRSQPLDRQSQLIDAVDKLMDGVANTLQSTNREKFTLNLTTFRHDVKLFIVNS